MLRWSGATPVKQLSFACFAQLVVGVLTAQLMTLIVTEAGAAATELRFLRLPEATQSTVESDPLASSGACIHNGQSQRRHADTAICSIHV